MRVRQGIQTAALMLDDTLAQVLKSGEIDAMYDKWLVKPVQPKTMSFDFPMGDGLRELYGNPNDTAFE